ncbi:hypothetical protein [Actinomadura decatromicini]|uniref:Uncharacterized protein n=1 Tax=Actinomadura decatromicini TaxID=2604572 RepID=A0A5D3FAX9_9ACTN|nr:hypothetical protein [Actinomadura decatromicini]TYK45088.1 hypothetical protein FXF68_30875 [Actinomadura decatromicini]
MPDEIPDAPEGWPSADPDSIVRARNDGGVRALIARAMWKRDYQPGAEANIGGMVYEIADRVAEQAVPEIERRALRNAADALLAAGFHEDRCSYGPPGTCDCSLGEHYRWLIARARG